MTRTRWIWSRWLVLLVVSWALAGVCLAGSSEAVDLDRGTLLDRAEFVLSDAASPPPSGWQAQKLPDNWRDSRPGRHGYGWYRFRLDLERQPGQTVGLYIAMVGTTSAVYVNGMEIGSSGAMQGEIQRGGGQPQLLTIPPQAFAPGENWLHVRLRVAPNLRGGMTTLSMGPRATLEQTFLTEHFWRVTLPRSANVALIVIGLMVGLLWLRQPQATVHAYFAALAVIWSLRNFHYTYNGSAFPSRLWEAFVLGSLGWILVLLWLFVLRLAGQARSRIELPASALFALMPWAFWAMGEEAMSNLRMPWYTVCVGLGFTIVMVLVRHVRAPGRERRVGPWIVLLALIGTLGFGLHDFATSAGWLPFGTQPLMPFGAPLLLASLVVALADRYFGTFDELQRLNATLEQRVEDRTVELQASHARMSDLQRIAVIAQERERLMRDIHDGVGSQLIAARQGLEGGTLNGLAASELLTQCMDDLRLVVDSLDPEQRHVADALATLRHRMQPRLEAAGLTSRWQIDQTPVSLLPEETLDLMRIVQEALSNVLKHSQARRATIRFTTTAATGWELCVEDDGRGMPEQGAPRVQPQGRGLGNLSRRATHLGSSLVIESAPASTGTAGFTRVRILHTVPGP